MTALTRLCLCFVAVCLWSGAAFADVLPLEGALQVVTGVNFSCALVEGGAVYCWGSGSQGQLGHGSWNDSAIPVRVMGIDNAVEIVGGLSHTCARLASGQVMCWGRGAEGLLSGAMWEITQPHLVPDLTDAISLVATQLDTTCAVRADQSVVCWGRNVARRPHGPEPETYDLPHPVDGLVGVAQLVAGGLHLCAIRGPERELVCLGLDHGVGELGRYDDPVVLQSTGLKDVQEVITYDNGTCYKRADTWDCWGSGTPVPGWSLSLGAYRLHTCAIDPAKHVWCWGENTYKQLGDGTNITRPLPTQVLAPASTELVALRSQPEPTGAPFTADQIAAGYDTTCALKHGDVFCWGRPGARKPTKLEGFPSGTNIEDIATGFGFFCARLDSGQVWCWGENTSEQLGDGTRISRPHPAPVVGLEDATAISLSYAQNCALRKTNDVFCWGGSESAVLVKELEKNRGEIVQVAMGEGHACVLMKSGEVFCRGANEHGQLGNGEGGCVDDPKDVRCGVPHSRCKPREICAESKTFVAAVGLKDATALALGGGFSCALRKGGKVLCWGNDAQGRLGLGAIQSRAWTPTEIPGLSGVLSLAAYNSHACAITADGQLLCWGQNVWGELGNRSKQSHTEPTPVFDFGNAAEVSPGMSHTCARRTDNTVWCWGNNDQGLLGVGIDEDISRLSKPYVVRE